MRKKFKQIWGIILTMVIILNMTALPAMAAAETQVVTLYSAKDKYRSTSFNNSNKATLVSKNKFLLTAASGVASVISVKSSKPSVASVSVTKPTGGSYAFMKVYVKLKKKGTTYITVKYTTTYDTEVHTYTRKLWVKKYTNPVESITIGKNTLTSDKFSSVGSANLKYSQFVNKKTAPKVTLKSGWKVNYIRYYDSNGSNTGLIDERFSPKIKVNGGKGSYFSIEVENQKTHQQEDITIFFN